MVPDGKTKFRLATARETHYTNQRRFQCKENDYIRAVPGFRIEGNVKKNYGSPKKKTMFGKRKVDTGKD